MNSPRTAAARSATIHLADEIDPQSPPASDGHMHTQWVDGADTVRAMHEAALVAGLTAIVFSEHARRSSGDWYLEFADEVRALDDTRCTAFVGVESKILDFDGAIDCNDAILQTAEIVMASVHRFPGEAGVISGTTGGLSGEQAINIEYCLASAALENPSVHVLGHPFGMSYKRFASPPPPRLMRDLIKKAARSHVAFEINSHYHPDPRALLRWCSDAGAQVYLGSNAHSRHEVGEIQRMLTGRTA
jgi:putative hydrolase